MMGHNDDRFSPEGIDEQIEQRGFAQSQPTPGDQLIHDLQVLAHSELQVDNRSLEHVWLQVQARRENVVVSAQRDERNLQAASRESEGKRRDRKKKEAMEDTNVSLGMNPSTPLSRTKKRSSIVRTVGMSLVAAVAIITILSFVLFSGVLRPAYQMAGKGSSTSPQQNTISQGKLMCSFSERETVPDKGVSVPWLPDLSWSTQGQIALANYANVKTYSAKNCSLVFSQPSLQRNYGVLWSPDGKMLAVSDSDDGTTYVLDNHGKIITKASPSGGERIWSLDSKKLIFISSDLKKQTIVTSLNISNGSLTTLMQVPSDGTALLFSPDHNLALVVEVNKVQKNFEIWDIKSGKKINTLALQGNRSSFFGWAFSPDGSQIATDIIIDGKIQIFSTANGKLLTSFENKVVSRRGMDTLVWSPDGKYIADSANVIKIYDVNAKKIAATFGKVGDQDWITTLTWAPDSRELASVTTRNLQANGVPSDITVNVWKIG